MAEYVLDITMSVRVDAEDFNQAGRIAAELEHRFLEQTDPYKARFWTRIEGPGA